MIRYLVSGALGALAALLVFQSCYSPDREAELRALAYADTLEMQRDSALDRAAAFQAERDAAVAAADSASRVASQEAQRAARIGAELDRRLATLIPIEDVPPDLRGVVAARDSAIDEALAVVAQWRTSYEAQVEVVSILRVALAAAENESSELRVALDFARIRGDTLAVMLAARPSPNVVALGPTLVAGICADGRACAAVGIGVMVWVDPLKWLSRLF